MNDVDVSIIRDISLNDENPSLLVMSNNDRSHLLKVAIESYIQQFD